MTLEKLLKEMGYTGDRAIVVIDGNTTMEVSPRYLEGGWKEVLEKEADWVGMNKFRINPGKDEFERTIYSSIFAIEELCGHIYTDEGSADCIRYWNNKIYEAMRTREE